MFPIRDEWYTMLTLNQYKNFEADAKFCGCFGIPLCTIYKWIRSIHSLGCEVNNVILCLRYSTYITNTHMDRRGVWIDEEYG